MARYFVAAAEEIPVGSRKVLTIGEREIGVFNVAGRYYALRNLCPHRGAPVCRGSVTGVMESSEPGRYDWGRQGEILRCPWHGWEFELASGKALLDEEMRVKTYLVTVEDEQLFIEL